MQVRLDEYSNRIMEDFVATLEDMLETRTGLSIHVARADQQPFHATLAVVDGAVYPMFEALDAVNALVPPYTWTSGFGPISLVEPPAINF